MKYSKDDTTLADIPNSIELFRKYYSNWSAKRIIPLAKVEQEFTWTDQKPLLWLNKQLFKK